MAGILTLTNIALGALPPDACPAGDPGGDGPAPIDAILLAVAHALSGCLSAAGRLPSAGLFGRSP